MDVFQQEHEPRDHYLERYASRAQHWLGLSGHQREAVVDHMRRSDIPARRGWIESVAADSGWTWTWAWDGQHRAEAVVVLQPCSSRATIRVSNQINPSEFAS